MTSGPEGGPLFRREAIESRVDRLHGTVRIAIPLGWHAIGILLVAVLVAASAFMATATYSRTIVAHGQIALAEGAAGVVPARPGVVQTVLVEPGARVVRGQPLVEIDTEVRAIDQAGAYEVGTRALRDRGAALARQADMLRKAGQEEAARAAAELRGLQDQTADLDGQIEAQRRLLALAEQEFREASQVAERGFVSRRELGQREGNVLARRQQLFQLRQEQARIQASVEALSRTMRQATASAGAQIAGVESGQAELARELGAREAERAYKLIAPIDGTVTALTARAGQPVGPGQVLLTIVPHDVRLRAELQVGTAAIGFLQEGMPVRLAVDAFPYQRFGMVPATVSEVALAATAQTSSDGTTAPVYLVGAELERAHVDAHGSRRPLRPGMVVSARIIAERRSLLEWLFEPLLSLARR